MCGSRAYPGRSVRLLASAFLFLFFSIWQPAYADKHYQYYIVGDSTNVARPQPATPSVALMGGGQDIDQVFNWMISKGGGGNFVVIRASGADAYNSYIYAMGGITSVETLVIPSREAANDEFVLSRIKGAEALFIAGGDQSDYIKYWDKTGVQTAVQELANRNIPVGGTSAGLAVMGQYLFSALNGTITSKTALSNPYDKNLVLGQEFLKLSSMEWVITDAHLASRDRMGRLVSFLARIVNDNWSSMARGIGVDDGTALLVDDGIGKRAGAGAVYFLNTTGLPEVCKPKTPLTYHNIAVQRLSGSGSFELRNWRSYDNGTVNYSISAIKGVLSSTQPGGAIY